jgi:aminopeptidase N
VLLIKNSFRNDTLTMSNLKQSYYVAAALVAAELHKAMVVAKDISLTASNAKALALRAGSSAAGFRALTDFIDELAKKTIYTSRHVNTLAVEISKIASEAARVSLAIEQFNLAYTKAQDAQFADSIIPAKKRTEKLYDDMQQRFSDLVWQLKSELDDIARELRTGIVLSAMSRVEATQAGSQYEESLNTIAENVALASDKIRQHVSLSQKSFENI